MHDAIKINAVRTSVISVIVGRRAAGGGVGEEGDSARFTEL